MRTGEFHWSLGVWIGLPIVAIVVLALIGIAVSLFVIGRGEHDPYVNNTGGALLVGALVVLVGAGVSWWPFAPVRDYHAWNAVQGTVERADKRLVAGDNGMSERYVIKFVESGTLYGCDDTRCSLAAIGTPLRLQCKREYVWRSVSGWACRYDQEG